MTPNASQLEQDEFDREQERTKILSLVESLNVKIAKCHAINAENIKANEVLTKELERYKAQNNSFQTDHERKNEFERGYVEVVERENTLQKRLDEQCFTNKHYVQNLNDEISNLKTQISKHSTTISNLEKEKKDLKNKYTSREDKDLENIIDLEKKNKELNNIIFKTGQSIQTIHMLTPKPNSYYDGKSALDYANLLYPKKAQTDYPVLYNYDLLCLHAVKYVDSNDSKHSFMSESEESLQCETESREKYKDREIKPIDYKALNDLYKPLFLHKKSQTKKCCS